MDKCKWYESGILDEDVILSSRVRLARNMKSYNFPRKLSDSDAGQMMKAVVEAVNQSAIADQIRYIPFQDISLIDQTAMVNRHCVSAEFLNAKHNRALLLKEDETISIMLNEEDHIRLQAIAPGSDIEGAYDMADKIDNLIEERVEFAFDQDLGYLTACPTNTGTGLRASYMVHIPFLERSGQLAPLLQAVGKFGITFRGIYGEGSQAMGSIYQISNQLTIGKSEVEMLETLKNVVGQIVERENALQAHMVQNNKIQLEDMVYRAFGLLSNARIITSKEAMQLLSDVRIGYRSGLLQEEKPATNIYHIMMNCQSGMIQYNSGGKEMDHIQRDIFRGEYLRTNFACCS